MPLLRPALVACLALAAACGGTPSLDGAVGEIAVFTPASLTDEARSYGSDVISDPMRFHSIRWSMETKASADAVIDFYTRQWPNAGRIDDPEAGTVWIRNPAMPADDEAPLTESVSVTVTLAPTGGKTQFVIEEEVLRHRRPGA